MDTQSTEVSTALMYNLLIHSSGKAVVVTMMKL